MVDWNKLADKKTVEKTAKALKEKGIEAIVVNTGDDAKKKALELIPKGAEVMPVTSTTLDQIGVSKAINDGDYVSIRKKIMEAKNEKERNELRKRSGNAEYAIGSVHAVTEEGQILIASASGSQLPFYAYSADKVIWIVGAQKIVKSLDEGFRRIYEHSLLLESERVKKAYGMPGSVVNKILVFEKEKPGRITLILVNEKLGF